MSYGIRIDKVTKQANNTILIEFTAGTLPLPSAPQGNQLEFPDQDAFNAQIRATTMEIQDRELVLWRLAMMVRSDPTMTNYVGMGNKSLSIDFATTGQAFVVS